MGFGNSDLSLTVKKRLWKGSNKDFCLLIIYGWTLYSNHMNFNFSLSPHSTSWLASCCDSDRDPGLRGGSVICGQAVSAAPGVLCNPFERQSGTNSAHPKFLLDLDVKTSSMWVHTKVIFCTVTLQVCSEHLLPSQSLFCGHGLLSSLLPWLHVSALASAGPSFVLLLLEGAGSRPVPVWTGGVLALQWHHQLGSWALVWVQGSRVTTALFELFFALFILCSPTKIYYPWDISDWHK